MLYLRRPLSRRPGLPREWCYDLTYQLGSWPTPRRVELVVLERPDDLLLHAFFPVTNLGKFDWPPAQILALYRKRGRAKAHMGKDVGARCAPILDGSRRLHLSRT